MAPGERHRPHAEDDRLAWLPAGGIRHGRRIARRRHMVGQVHHPQDFGLLISSYLKLCYIYRVMTLLFLDHADLEIIEVKLLDEAVLPETRAGKALEFADV